MGSVSEEQMERIEVARLVGLFIENGFVYIDEANKIPINRRKLRDALS